jgi:hypothetical protein
MNGAPYGYCPTCDAPGLMRERRPNGNDVCDDGHTYPSRMALSEPKGTPRAHVITLTLTAWSELSRVGFVTLVDGTQIRIEDRGNT